MFQCCNLNCHEEKKPLKNIRYFKVTHIKTSIFLCYIGKYTIKQNKKIESSGKSYNFIHHSSNVENSKYSWLNVNCYKTANEKIALFHIVNKK